MVKWNMRVMAKYLEQADDKNGVGIFPGKQRRMLYHKETKGHNTVQSFAVMPSKMKPSHQVFLQSFMSRGLLNGSDVFSLHRKSRELCGDVIAEEDQREKLVEFVNVINNNLKPFGMELKKGTDELDGTGYYGLVNTTESSINLCASQYTENELEFSKKLVEMIMTSEAGIVGSMAAVNIADSLSKKMSKSDADNLLERLQAAKWLDKTESGKLYLSTRALLELEQYILDMYPDNAVKCNMCKRVAVQGQTCTECGTKLHNHCFKKFFKDGADNKCPSCRSTWVSVGTDPQTSGNQSRKRKNQDEDSEVIYKRNWNT